MILSLFLGLSTCDSVFRPDSPLATGAKTVLVAGNPAAMRDVSEKMVAARRAVCGCNFAHSWEAGGKFGYGSDASYRSLRELAKVGIDHINITPFGWMSSEQDDRIKYSLTHSAGENERRMTETAKRAHAFGMRVMLKPHIWINGGISRQKIRVNRFKSSYRLKRWQASYRNFIFAYARVASKIKAEQFVVGLELDDLVIASPKFWRVLIADLRKIYSGEIIYAANWDRVAEIPIWDAVDAIGIQFFAPLLDRIHFGANGAPEVKIQLLLASATKRAGSWLRRYQKTAKRYGKAIMLTEAGFLNHIQALLKPYQWPDHLSNNMHGNSKYTANFTKKYRTGSQLGETMQRIGYQAVIDTFGASSIVHQIDWWKWFSNLNSREEYPVGFSPLDKPAMELLQANCQRTHN